LQRFRVSYKNGSGKVKYSNVGLLPTSTPYARSWVITQQAVLLPQDNPVYEFEYDFSQVIFDVKDFVVNFTGPVQGTGFLSTSRQPINIQRSVTYTYNFQLRKLFFSLEIPCLLQKPKDIFLNMYINDPDLAYNGFYLLQNQNGSYIAATNSDTPQLNIISSLGALYDANENNLVWILNQSPSDNQITISNTNGIKSSSSSSSYTITSQILQAVNDCQGVSLSSSSTCNCPFSSDNSECTWVVDTPDASQPDQVYITSNICEPNGNLTIDSSSESVILVNQSELSSSTTSLWTPVQIFLSSLPPFTTSATPFFAYTISYTLNGTTYSLGVDATTSSDDTPRLFANVPSTETNIQWYINPVTQICTSTTQQLSSVQYTIGSVYRYPYSPNNRGFLIPAGTQPSNVNPGLWDQCACCPNASGQCQNGQCLWTITLNPQPTTPISYSLSSTVNFSGSSPATFVLGQSKNNTITMVQQTSTTTVQYWNIEPVTSYPQVPCQTSS
jgi:hypothetical protein